MKDESHLTGAVQKYPTPSAHRRGAHNGKEAGTVDIEGRSRVSSNGTKWGATLETVVGSGKLNPTWVEWLMGFPPGWTDLKDLATP